MIHRRFRGLPIRQKLVAMIMLTVIAVMLTSSAAYLAWDYYRLRADLRAELRAEAQLILDNSSAAVKFGDERVGAETLATLAAAPRVQLACLYGAGGELFASWARSGTADCAASPPADGVVFAGTELSVSAPGYLESRQFGKVYLRSDTGVLSSRLRVQAIATLVLIGAALVLAWALSSMLQALVSVPVLQLARAAADVSSRGDYSVRAEKVTEDELGTLVDAFNGMLQQIQQRERELREANRLKDEFLATLSHELRTPLNAILGWTRLLRAGALPSADYDRALEKVERNAQAQARLVEDLLEVSRITTGKLRLEQRPVDLASIVNAAVESVRPVADSRSLTLNIHGLDERLPSLGDPDRLQQVVWNLLSNAVKFTPARGEVAVSLRRANAVDELVVSDTGIGIEPSFLGHVFDTFRQADATSTRQVGGLGLGLSIARRLVELHGGTIEAASAGVGRGATFTVRLPVREAGRPQESVPLPGPGDPGGRLAAARILVVDDERDTLEMVASVLEGAGATVFPATNADEALRAAIAHHPRVLVTDIGLPGTDGWKLLQEIREALGNESPAVTIAITAYAAAADLDRSSRAGFQRHLAKPFDPLALVAIVAGMLEETGP